MTALQCATSLVIARHGEAESEAPAWAEEGGSLTQQGRQQAAALGESLADRRVAHVWTRHAGPRRADRRDHRGPAQIGTTRLGLREFGVGDFLGVASEEDPFAATYAR